MIFLGLFLFIIIVVGALNIHNHLNLSKIEEYLNTQNCKEYQYSRGSYKALCEENFLEVKNSFTVDIEKNSKIIPYKNIKNLTYNDSKIFIDDYYLEFKDKNDLTTFYVKLKEKIK